MILNSKRLRGFTLIELLIVIAIIALLVSILLPVLSGVRKAAFQTREMAGLSQLGMGYASYSNDNRDKLMPGYLRGSWAAESGRKFIAYDEPEHPSEENRIVSTPLRPYTWRMMPYMNFAYEVMFADRTLRSLINERPRDMTDRTAFHTSVARNPSFGMNTTFVGGDAHRGGFTPAALLRFGAFYVTRMDQPAHSDRLITFTTARGILRDTGGQKVPGYHRIEAPWHATPTSNSVPAFIPWTGPRGKFDPNLDTTAYGHVDFRHAGKAGVLTFDAHAELLGIDKLVDMTRWCNKATRADWHP